MLDPVHFAVRNLLWAILQDNTEFITAKTGKQVVFARGLLHGIDKMAEIAVSLTVAIVVVDVFQMSRVFLFINRIAGCENMSPGRILSMISWEYTVSPDKAVSI